MKKRLVLKDTENNKYFTNEWDPFWSLDINDAHCFDDHAEIEKVIETHTNPENTINSFEDVDCVKVETIYIIIK